MFSPAWSTRPALDRDPPTRAGAQLLRRVWLSRLVRDVFRRRAVSILLARLQGRSSLIPSTAVSRLIERLEALTGCYDFRDQRVPLAVVATDMGAGRRVVF